MVQKALRTLQIGLLVASAALSCAHAASDDARFLDGLRQRQLFQLAESYCRRRADDPTLDATQQAFMVSELIRTYSAHAVNSPPDQRAPLWQAARDTAAGFQANHSNHPRKILIEVQAALTELARGELARQEAEVLANPDESLSVAKSAIREAARRLDQLDQRLTQLIPQRYRTAAEEHELTAEELVSLQYHLRYHQARAYRNRALCYPEDSDDRLAALTAAVDALKRGLEQVAPEQPLYWQLQIELLTCFRSLGDFDQAQQTVVAIAQGSPPPSIQLRARAEAVRILLDRHRPSDAYQLLQPGREVDGTTSPELDYACLQTYLALWKQADGQSNQPEADRWRQKAVAMVELIEATYGVYWGRRSDLLLVKTAGGAQASGDVELLTRTADNLYRKQQYDDAVTAYQQAGEAALSAGDASVAFPLFYKAALVEHTRQRHVEAAGRLRALAVKMPEHAQSPDAHLLAAWNAAQAARLDAAQLEQYQSILEEHVQLWPASASANKARIWLGRLLEGRQQWAAAADAFAGVSPSAEQFGEALDELTHCWQSRIQQTQQQGESVEALARDAAQQFQRHITDPPPENWGSAERKCAEVAARMLLNYVPDGHAQAETILRAAINGAPPPSDAWKQTATPLLVLALAGQPDGRVEAKETLLGIGDDSPERLMEVFRGLAQQVATASAEAQHGLAELQLGVLDQLGPKTSQLPEDQQQFLRRARAEALLLAGQRDEAVKAYAALAAEHPQDAAIQLAYAQILLDAPDAESWQKALETWRRIAGHSQPQTDPWYRSRFSISLALYKLSQKKEAAARIRYLQTVPPGLDQPPWRDRFADLLKKCESP